MPLPSYSVVIPVYNNGGELRRAVESVLSQSLSPESILLINDCSAKPETKALLGQLSELDRVTVIHLQRNLGAAGARNVGIYHAEAPIVAFLDADDAWVKDKMECQLSLMQAAQCTAVGARVSTDRRVLFAGKDIVELKVTDLLVRHVIQTSSFVAKRDALLSIGGFPEGRRYAEEGDLYLKMLSVGRVLFMNRPLVIYGDEIGLNSSRGLSSHKTKMFLGELANLNNCQKRAQIGILSWLGLLIFTTIRYLRRILLAN